MERNDMYLIFGGLILTWILGLIQGYAIGRQPVTRKLAAKVLAQASAKARKAVRAETRNYEQVKL